VCEKSLLTAVGYPFHYAVA